MCPAKNQHGVCYIDGNNYKDNHECYSSHVKFEFFSYPELYFVILFIFLCKDEIIKKEQIFLKLYCSTTSVVS